MKRREPPKDAERIEDENGRVLGWINLRQPIDGNAYKGGWDCYRGSRGTPWRVFETRGDAEFALRALRNPRPPYDDWQVGDK
jgi:hypothetical protein